MDWGKRLRTLLCAVGIGAAAVAPAATPAHAADFGLKLTVGRAVFWPVVHFDSASVSDDAACTATTCPTYPLTLAGGAARLRVAIDKPGNTRSDVAIAPGATGSILEATADATVELYNQAGKLLKSSGGPYSAEVFLANPQVTRYFVRAKGRKAGIVRMRAKLESALPAKPTGARELLPNLRMIPPFDFTFASPFEPVIAGRDPVGCNPYEQQEYGAHRCLRYSLGPENVGEGPFMVRINGNVVKGLVGKIPVTQLILRADGKIDERPGGYSIYHKTHAHFHHNGFGSIELVKVLDPAKGTMAFAGASPKQGFCTLDYKIADWHSFINHPAGEVRQDCQSVGSPGAKPQLGLGVGWGDLYHYHLDGNYVEFGENGDGLYVVRCFADAFNDIKESNETDNAGYAYIRVTGMKIDVLERGRGTSPWDANKVVVNDDNMPLTAPPATGSKVAP